VLYHFNVLVKTASGREIGFTTLGGRGVVDWPERSPGLPDGPDTFSPMNLFGLEKALRGEQVE
jgi:hypothetical protein